MSLKIVVLAKQVPDTRNVGLGVKGLGFGVKGVGAAGAAAAGEHGHKKQRADNGRKCAFHTEISYSFF